MLPVIAAFFTILKIFVAFSVLILIHEFGHFVTAKISGVWVEEFGLGLPPRIFGRKIGDTVYSLNLLPIGGFVKLHGETSSDQVIYPERAFTNKKKATKVLITIAGIFMNMVLAVLAFAIIFWVIGIPGKVNLTITGVSEKSPAALAGVMAGDIVEKVDSKTINNGDEFKNEIASHKGKEIGLTLRRNGKEINLKATPRVNPPAGEGSLGVEFADIEESVYPPIWQRPIVTVWWGIKQTAEITKLTVFGLGNAAGSVAHGEAPKGVSGPLGILAIFKLVSELGILPLINLVGVISINLAVINLVPFPPLDGSRVALVIVEWITRRRMTAKMEERVYLVGFIVLIGFMLLITSREIPALIQSGGIDKYASSLLNGK